MNIITAIGYVDGYGSKILNKVDGLDLTVDLAQWGAKHCFGMDDWFVYQYDQDVLSNTEFHEFIRKGEGEFCEGCLRYYLNGMDVPATIQDYPFLWTNCKHLSVCNDATSYDACQHCMKCFYTGEQSSYSPEASETLADPPAELGPFDYDFEEYESTVTVDANTLVAI